MNSESQHTRVRVLVVDDQALMRDGIASLLNLEPGVTVVGTAANGEEAVLQAITLRPDVILMDVRMPIMDGVAATAQIRRDLGETPVLMLTTFDDDAYVLAALQAGATGYLLKDLPAADLAQAILAAHRRIYQLDQSIAAKLIATLTPLPPPPTASARPPIAELSEREREVLRLVSTGATNREIADSLFIGEATVKSHISNILGRLGLRDRTQAAMYARDHGLE